MKCAMKVMSNIVHYITHTHAPCDCMYSILVSLKAYKRVIGPTVCSTFKYTDMPKRHGIALCTVS